MRASRGMGDINPSKMPGKKMIHRKDKPQDVEMYAKGGSMKNVTVSKAGTPSSVVKKLLTKPGSLKAADLFAKGGKAGLYENIHKKQARIAAGSGEHMRKPGSKGAPTKADFIKSAKTARKK
jgi:hypothetical protein